MARIKVRVMDLKVTATAALLSMLAIYKLYETALTTGNWRGLYFSAAHIAVVVVGVVYGIGFREEEDEVDLVSLKDPERTIS